MLMRFFRQLFSFNGRISRRQFWLGHAAIFCISAIFAVIGGIALGIAGAVFDRPDLAVTGPLVIGGLVSIGALIAETSLAVRRMHDRNGSAAWVVLLVGVVMILNVTISAQRLLYGEPIIDPITVGLTVFAIIMGGWMLFELGFMSGSNGRNRFGDSPLTDGTSDDGEPVTVQQTQSAI